MQLTVVISANGDVCEQAVRILGNIASCCVKYRNIVLSSGALTAMLLLADSNRLTNFHSVDKTISKLCKGKPSSKFDLLRLTLPVLSRLLNSHVSETIIIAASTILSMCHVKIDIFDDDGDDSDDDDDNFDVVDDDDDENSNHSNEKYGNIEDSSDDEGDGDRLQAVIDTGVGTVRLLIDLLSHVSERVQKLSLKVIGKTKKMHV